MGEVSLQCREAARRGAGPRRASQAVAIASPASERREDDALCSDRCPAVSIAVAGCLSLSASWVCFGGHPFSSCWITPRRAGSHGLGVSRCFRSRCFYFHPLLPPAALGEEGRCQKCPQSPVTDEGAEVWVRTLVKAPRPRVSRDKAERRQPCPRTPLCTVWVLSRFPRLCRTARPRLVFWGLAASRCPLTLSLSSSTLWPGQSAPHSGI